LRWLLSVLWGLLSILRGLLSILRLLWCGRLLVGICRFLWCVRIAHRTVPFERLRDHGLAHGRRRSACTRRTAVRELRHKVLPAQRVCNGSSSARATRLPPRFPRQTAGSIGFGRHIPISTLSRRALTTRSRRGDEPHRVVAANRPTRSARDRVLAI
jgi:hypothetical protein